MCFRNAFTLLGLEISAALLDPIVRQTAVWERARGDLIVVEYDKPLGRWLDREGHGQLGALALAIDWDDVGTASEKLGPVRRPPLERFALLRQVVVSVINLGDIPG